MCQKILTEVPDDMTGSYSGGYYGSPGTYRPGAPVVVTLLCAEEIQFAGINAIMRLLTWKPDGRIRFRCVDITGAGANTVTTGWSVTGVADPAGVEIAGGMIVGNEYRLYYNLDTIPNVPGWDDAAFVDMGIQWVQPIKEAPLDTDYSGV